MNCIYFEKRDVSSSRDIFDHPEYKCICKKDNKEVLEYYCQFCKDRNADIAEMENAPDL